MFFKNAKRIKELELENKRLIGEGERLKNERDDYKSRLRRAGNAEYAYFDAERVKVYHTEVRGIPYGTYAKFPGIYGDASPVVEQMKKQVAEKLAEGLIENELLQFIVKGQNGEDPLSRYATVGVKAYIIPWEQMTAMPLYLHMEVHD